MKKYKIGIVTVIYIESDLHYRMAYDALASFTSHNHIIMNYGVINKCSALRLEALEEYYSQIMTNDENGLAIAWNKGIKAAFADGCDYVLVPNLDVLFSENTIDNLIAFAETHPEAVMWTASETKNKLNIEAEANDGFADSPHFSCFMVCKELFEQLEEIEANTSEPFPGWFDENIKPAYHEDGDFHYRMKKAGLLALRTATSMFYHYGSGTIHGSDDPRRAEIMLGSGGTRGYYMSKHGGMPGNEVFKTPFNK